MEHTVLVVDDEELLRRYVARVIADEGYRVFVLPGPVLWKPFLADDLRARVRGLLDAKTARFARRSAQSGLTCTRP